MDKPSSSPGPQHEALTARVRDGVRNLVQSVEAIRDRAAKLQHLHPTDFACLSYLKGVGGPVSPKQINAQLNLSSGSGTALLDRLEKAGYTRRLPNPDDRRSILIELDLEKAEEPLRRLLEIEPSYRTVMESFSEAELEAIARFMEEMGAFVYKLS